MSSHTEFSLPRPPIPNRETDYTPQDNSAMTGNKFCLLLSGKGMF